MIYNICIFSISYIGPMSDRLDSLVSSGVVRIYMYIILYYILYYILYFIVLCIIYYIFVIILYIVLYYIYFIYYIILCILFLYIIILCIRLNTRRTTNIKQLFSTGLSQFQMSLQDLS